jgi:hypothetical protein
MKKLSGWQKAGVFAGIGCFSIVAVIVLGVVIAVFWARATLAEHGDPNPTRNERTIALGEPVVEAPDRAGTPGAAAKGAATGGEPLRLTLDLEEGIFIIRPGPPAAQVKVEGTYAEGLFELTESHAAAQGRTTIRFRSKAPAWARMLGGMESGGPGGRPTVTVLIPAGVPIDLSLRVSLGESRIDLGGLTLRELGLDLSMGNHEVDFREPVVDVLRRVRLEARMGNISVDNLGNARAQTIDTSGSMGNLTVDLAGAWQPGAGADLSFTHSMGELTLNVPRQVRLETNVSSSMGQVNKDPAGAAEAAAPDAPVVRLRMSTSMGEGRVIRY